MNNFNNISANLEYTTHIKFLNLPGILVIVDDIIYHFILVSDNDGTLFHEEIFRQSKKQNLLKSILNKNCSSCLHQAEFPEGRWVEKISNILKHAPASQHVQMLGVLKSKMMVSLPNSPLFQISDLKAKLS